MSSGQITFGAALVLLGSLGASSAAAHEELSGYVFSASQDALPSVPVRLHLIDATARAPEGAQNPCVEWIDARLSKALNGRLKEFWPRHTWQEAPQFLNWAVWGYLSPDSEHQGDSRLVDMAGKWIVGRIHQLETPPADESKRGKWKPRRLNSWSFHHDSIPLLELLHRPALVAEVGSEHVAAWRALCIENVQRWGEQNAWNDLAGRADTYVNIATHPMAAFVHGWILTGEIKYLRMASHIVGLLARDQAPHGTFPYRCFGGDHLEAESMYYHSMNVRALYLYWWHTDSSLAADVLRRSVPYYPLRMAPRYHFEDASTIWWKDQWRTFWPQHIAMVAAVSGDGENATIAAEMARDNRGSDRTDLVLGAHAYQRMAIQGVKEAPRRDAFILADPDIGGLRGRYGHVDFSFSTNSYGHTLAGAVVTDEERRAYSALHRACAYVRVAPLTENHRTDPNYCAMGKASPPAQLVIGDRFAVAGATYVPFQPSSTWRPIHRSTPWKMVQVWLYTPDTMLGLLIDEPLLTVSVRGVEHHYQFILPKSDTLEFTENGTAESEHLRFRVHATNLDHRVMERVRRYALNPKGRQDWRIALTDCDRSPEEEAQVPDADREALVLLEPRAHAPGTRRYSLVEVGPRARPGATDVALGPTEGHVAHWQVRVGARSFLVGVNFHDFGADFEYAVAAELSTAVLHRSWGPEDERKQSLSVVDGKLAFSVREAGVFAVVW